MNRTKLKGVGEGDGPRDDCTDNFKLYTQNCTYDLHTIMYQLNSLVFEILLFMKLLIIMNNEDVF